MRSGTIGAVLLAVVLGAVSFGGAILALQLPASERGSLVLAGLVSAIVFILGVLVLIPAGIMLDRTLRGTVQDLKQALEKDVAPSAIASRWWKGVANSLHEAVAVATERRREMQSRIRDLELLQRATDAERAQLQGVLDELRDAVIVTDAFDEVLIANRAAAEALGFTRESARRKPVASLIKDVRLLQVIRDVREAGNVGDRRSIEHEIRQEDGMTPYEITVSCLANMKREVGAVVTILHDQRREREISQMKSDFVSKASHELRTPLSSIRAYVEMLVDGEATDEESRNEFYGVIQNETERLGRLIDNMLNISRIEAGIVQIDREIVDFRALIQRAIDTLEPQAKSKNMVLNAKVAPVDLTVEGDADMLYQVILNLVSNGVKYTPEGGRITISADSDNLTRSVVVAVSDTGLGIPPDALPKLFDKFFRVENFKRVAKGTGLGLNLCKHIVETVHHGQIGVDSKLGMGSKFWFSVPMRYAGSQAAA